MDYEIKKLDFQDLDDFLDSFIETFENLTNVGDLGLESAKTILQKMIDSENYIFVAINKEKWILGTITLLVQHGFARWWKTAWHIENVVVRKWFEGLWIWKALVEYAMWEVWKHNCYKVILDCNEELVEFYGKYWFENWGVFMRKYC